jgi:predicted DNA-binding WGR domain protein
MIHISTALKTALGSPMTYQTTFEPTFLHHEGGTKFYEVIAFNNPDTGQHFIVRRWGKMKTKGEVKIEIAKTTRGSMGLKERAIESKRQRGYSPVAVTEGLHSRARSFVDESEMKLAFVMHYGPDNASKVAAAFGISLSGAAVDKTWIDELETVPPVAAKPPAPTVDRGQEWGSW